MSGVPAYDELFGGATRGAFAVKRAMRKAKNTIGYVPQAKPVPVKYSKITNKSEHIQKTIGAVPDADVVKFKRPTLTAEDRERNKRLKPETWGIDPADLEYNERQNRSFFKVDGVDGYFAFPPVKWTDSKNKDWYGLAHYAEKPDEEAKRKGVGGEHFDSIAFPADATPSEAVSGDMSVGYTLNTMGREDAKRVNFKAEKGYLTDDITNNGKKLTLAKGAVGHTRSFIDKEVRYGYWVPYYAGEGYDRRTILDPTAEVSPDAPLKERLKACRQIVSMCNALYISAGLAGDLNNKAIHFIDKFEGYASNIEELEPPTHKRKNYFGDTSGNTYDDGTYTNPIVRDKGKLRPVYETRPTGRFETIKNLGTRQITKSRKVKSERLERVASPRLYPQVPSRATGNWKTSYQYLIRSLRGVLKEGARPMRGITTTINGKQYLTPSQGSYDELATLTVELQESRMDAIGKNEGLLEDLGYDGRYSNPAYTFDEPRPHTWDTPEIKKEKAKAMKVYNEKLAKLKTQIKDGTAPKNWWKYAGGTFGT
jgi:hypothetical protein